MNKGISDSDIFKLMDVLTINDASALIAGCSPNQVRENFYNQEIYYHLDINRDDPANANEVFDIALKSLQHAIKRGMIRADIVVYADNTYLNKVSNDTDWLTVCEINTARTTVTRDDLKQWLESRGVFPPMLFPNGKKDDYMDLNHPHYSPKLALCVRAWEAAQTTTATGITIKQFMLEWMQQNAKHFGVNNKNPKVFDELATVSNWDSSGKKLKSPPPSEQENNKQDTGEFFEENNKKLLAKTFNFGNQADLDDIPF